MLNQVKDQFEIGYFGDVRREAVGAKLFRSINEKGTLIIRRLAKDRAEQVRFSRFLWSESVTIEEIKHSALKKTRDMAALSEHVLCFQDTTEVDISKRKNDIDISSIGLLKNRDESGFYLHPVLAMDDRDDFILGLSSICDFDYGRPRVKVVNHIEAKKPIEEKKSFRWIACAEESKKTLADAKMVTIIGDRENDFYEFYTRVPKDNFHILVRCKGERMASATNQEAQTGINISDLINQFEILDTRTLNIPSRAAVKTGKTKAQRPMREQREAILNLKYGTCFLYRSKKSPSICPEKIMMSFVEVSEFLPKNTDIIEPIHWLLLTSHPIESLQDAWRIVGWYKKRWNIEQLFRTAKKGGMQIENIELSKGSAIKKLCFLGLLASVRILQLTLCREGKIERPVAGIFTKNEIKVLDVTSKKYEGKTEKQKNPYKKNTVAWAYWIIGRMGGWKGYIQSEGPAGPLTLKRGLDELHSLVRGWMLYHDVCIT